MNRFVIIQPTALLAPFVKHYWFLCSDAKGVNQQRVIPTGMMTLVFHRSRSLYSVTDNEVQPHAFFSGQSTRYYDLVQDSEVDMIVVVFKSHGAKAFFDFPMFEVAERSVLIDDLEDLELIELEQKLMDAHSNAQCVDLIEAFLTSKLRRGIEYNQKRISAVIGALNNGETNIAKLAEISCLSEKQFRRLFSDFVGANPKDYVRIVRFQKALYIVQANPSISMAQLAFDCGYFDQAHMIKDFKRFSGYTPKEFMAICGGYSDYFTD